MQRVRSLQGPSRPSSRRRQAGDLTDPPFQRHPVVETDHAVHLGVVAGQIQRQFTAKFPRRLPGKEPGFQPKLGLHFQITRHPFLGGKAPRQPARIDDPPRAPAHEMQRLQPPAANGIGRGKGKSGGSRPFANDLQHRNPRLRQKIEPCLGGLGWRDDQPRHAMLDHQGCGLGLPLWVIVRVGEHGGKTVVIARFIPIVRTFAPFVAGIGRMVVPRFMMFAFGGAVLWIGSLVYAGYFFGNIPWVKNNLSLVIVGIVVLSILPGIIEFLRHKLGKRAS